MFNEKEITSVDLETVRFNDINVGLTLLWTASVKKWIR